MSPQDAIRSVSKEGRHLLSSLEASGKEDDSQWDVKLDWETVQRYDVFKQPFHSHIRSFVTSNSDVTQDRHEASSVFRLLAQLRDMESAFDGFFEKHHLKLHQYLQLLKYEQSFQEVRIPCMCEVCRRFCLRACPYFHTAQDNILFLAT